MNEPEYKLSILHVIVSPGETNSQYNEHCLPMVHQRHISICTYFPLPAPPPPELVAFQGNGTLGGFFRALKQALSDRQYDAVHVHAPITGVLFLIALLRFSLYGKIMPSAVYTVHNSYPNYSARNKLLLLPIFACFPALVFCSHAARDSFPSALKKWAGKRMFAVQNAVNLDRIDEAISGVEHSNQSDRFVILSVGRLIPVKNPFTLLSAFGQASDDRCQWQVIGEGALRTQLTEEIAKQGIPQRINFTGLVTRDEVFQNAARADVYVSTSLGEGLPVAVLEVMACRCPVILSNIPPHREIAAGVDFIPLIDPDDVGGFAREIRRFREMSPEKRQNIGDRCRKLVEQQFSLSSMHREYEAVYTRRFEKSASLMVMGNG